MSAPIFEAVRSADLGLVRSILEADPSQAGVQDEDGDQPLHRTSSPEIAKILIEHGADVNGRGADEMSALQAAAERSAAEVVRILISHGANLDYVNPMGRTSLLHAIAACSSEALEIVDLLLKAGANYDLLAATARGDLARVREIFQDNPNAVSQMSALDKEDLLGLASRDRPPEMGGIGGTTDRAEIIRLLFAHGFDLDGDFVRSIADKHSNSVTLAKLLRQYAK